MAYKSFSRRAAPREYVVFRLRVRVGIRFIHSSLVFNPRSIQVAAIHFGAAVGANGLALVVVHGLVAREALVHVQANSVFFIWFCP